MVTRIEGWRKARVGVPEMADLFREAEDRMEMGRGPVVTYGWTCDGTGVSLRVCEMQKVRPHGTFGFRRRCPLALPDGAVRLSAVFYSL